MALEDVSNFVAIDERLATGGQPTEEQLASVRERGFEVVINLGLLDPRYCLPDEAGSVAALGLEYHHVPVNFQQPKPSDFEEFRRLMQQTAELRRFVHCAKNMRVSCFVALFGELELGWSRERADAHVRKVWEPDPVWAEFLRTMREAHAE